MRTLGEWQECKERRTGVVFYFNSRTRTGVDTLEEIEDADVVSAAHTSFGRQPQDWVADDTLNLSGQSFAAGRSLGRSRG